MGGGGRFWRFRHLVSNAMCGKWNRRSENMLRVPVTSGRRVLRKSYYWRALARADEATRVDPSLLTLFALKMAFPCRDACPCCFSRLFFSIYPPSHSVINYSFPLALDCKTRGEITQVIGTRQADVLTGLW